MLFSLIPPEERINKVIIHRLPFGPEIFYLRLKRYVRQQFTIEVPVSMALYNLIKV